MIYRFRVILDTEEDVSWKIFIMQLINHLDLMEERWLRSM